MTRSLEWAISENDQLANGPWWITQIVSSWDRELVISYRFWIASRTFSHCSKPVSKSSCSLLSPERLNIPQSKQITWKMFSPQTRISLSQVACHTAQSTKSFVIHQIQKIDKTNNLGKSPDRLSSDHQLGRFVPLTWWERNLFMRINLERWRNVN